MPLKEALEKQGNWLFRRRGYLPLLLFAIAIAGIIQHAKDSESVTWEMICLGISLMGLWIRIITIGFVPKNTSGRNIKRQVADTLNTTGIYSVMRHPLYIGNFYMWLGAAMFTRSWWACGIFILTYWLYYERIMLAEEEFLRGKFGDTFVQWASKTPACLPFFWHWKKSPRQFCLKKVIRQEHSGILGLLLTFGLLDTLQTSIRLRKFDYDPMWVWICGVGLMTFLIVHVLKKQTRLLHND